LEGDFHGRSLCGCSTRRRCGAFADTFYYLALVDPTDEAHKRTLALSEKRRGRVITTVWVLTEALTGDHHFEQAGFRVLLGLS
jgi:hypothetical protein